MDNVCHTLVGGVLARAGCDRLAPLATPTLLVAANLPDIDVVSGFWGDLAYLAYHRGITHSVLGLVVETPLLAAIFVLVDGIVRRVSRTERPPAKFWRLVIASAIGLSSHTVLDWTNSYGVRPWLPFDGTWVYGDIVFVVDPWLWLLLGSALFLGASRRWVAHTAWLALFAAMAALVIGQQRFTRAESGDHTAQVLWVALLLAMCAIRWRTPSPLDARRLAVAALVGMGLYWSGLAFLRDRAIAGAESAGTGTGGTVAAIPMPMRPDRWRVLQAGMQSIVITDIRLSATAPAVVRTIPRRLDEPAVVSAMNTCPGAVAMGFNRFLFADVVGHQPDGSCTVLLKDARFAGVVDRSGFGTTPVTLDGDMRLVPDGRSCPAIGQLW